MTSVVFRCRGRSDREDLHVVRADRRGAMCSCQGVDWCSHIDATLVAGERHMVPEEDRPAADRAQRLTSGRIRAPTDWQASWRDNRVWRGLAPPRGDDAAKLRMDGRPVVLFLGSGPAGNRSEYVDQARSLGWRVVEQPHALVTLVVAPPEALATRRGEAAMRLGLPIVDPSDWDEWAYDITNAAFDRIDELSTPGRAA